MRTTVSLPDRLVREAKVLAARTDRSMSSVLEEALQRFLDAQESARGSDFELPTCPGDWAIDVTDNSAILDFLDRPQAPR